jgi:hypothetical protein
MLSHSWKRSWPADGEIFSNLTVVGGDASLSLWRCLAVALQDARAGICLEARRLRLG